MEAPGSQLKCVLFRYLLTLSDVTVPPTSTFSYKLPSCSPESIIISVPQLYSSLLSISFSYPQQNVNSLRLKTWVILISSYRKIPGTCFVRYLTKFTQWINEQQEGLLCARCCVNHARISFTVHQNLIKWSTIFCFAYKETEKQSS